MGYHSIVNTSGQLQTRAALDYETKTSYSVTVSVSDGNGGTDSITVTINVTDVYEIPKTTVSQRTPEVRDAIIAAVPDADKADDVTPEHLAAITELDLSYYDITSLKSGDFSGLTGLTKLELQGNSISDISALKGLTALKELNLSQNTISDISALEGLTKLTTLYLWDNSISDISVLEGLTKLTTLYLWGNPISDYDPLRRLLAAIAEIEDHLGLTLDINIPPVFTEGTSTTRAVPEYTPSDQNIGDPVSATDVDSEYLTYTLEGTDADSFRIDAYTGQLQTSAALNYETKSSYSVTVSVSDDYDNTDSITVTINVTDVDESRITPVNERTQQVQDAIVTAAFGVYNADDVTPGHLAAITELDLSYYDITSLKSGDFSGLSALTKLNLSGNSISNISPLSGLSTLTALNLSGNSISNIWPLRGLTTLTKLDLSDNSIRDISPLRGLTALIELDLSDNSISNVSALERLTALTTLYLENNPISNYGPLRRLVAAIAGIEGHQGLTLDVNIPPVFTEGTHTRRYVAEYTPFGQDIGEAVSATDANNDTLTYSLGGADADAFNIGDSTGQLQTNAALNYRTKSSYSVTISVSDGNEGTDSINVTIYVRDVDESRITPVNQRTQQVQDAIMGTVPVDNADDVTPGHLAAITGLYLDYKDITSLKSGDFSGLSGLTNLALNNNSISDISALTDLTALKELNLSQNTISDISALEGLTKLTTLYLGENTISDVSALEGLTKLTYLYLDRNTISDVSALEGLTKLTYLYLENNPISDYAPLRKLKKANPDIDIDIDIDNNNPPQFTDGDNTTRSIPENTESGTNIGEPISATDTDWVDTSFFSLSYGFAPARFGGDAALFAIDATSGQLSTKADLDYEERTSYTVIVDVYDSSDALDRITVTINITDEVGAAPSAETSSIIPKKTELLTNFPNPFNPETWIPYQLAKPAEVTLTLYDIRGVVVRELKLGHQPAGIYHNRSRAIHWDGRNAFGEKVATGVYFYTLKAGDFTATRKLLIRK